MGVLIMTFHLFPAGWARLKVSYILAKSNCLKIVPRFGGRGQTVLALPPPSESGMFSGFGVPSAKTPAFRTLQENPGRCLAVLAGTAKIEMFPASRRKIRVRWEIENLPANYASRGGKLRRQRR